VIPSTGTEHLPSKLFQSFGLPGEGAGKIIQVMMRPKIRDTTYNRIKK